MQTKSIQRLLYKATHKNGVIGKYSSQAIKGNKVVITLNGTLYELTHITQAGNYLMLTLVPFVGPAIIITLPVLAVENVDYYKPIAEALPLSNK